MEKYVFLAIWWFGALSWLSGGLFALLAPVKWISSSGGRWFRAWMPNLSMHPIWVRLLGFAMTCVGAGGIVKGIQILSRTALNDRTRAASLDSSVRQTAGQVKIAISLKVLAELGVAYSLRSGLHPFLSTCNRNTCAEASAG
jgi:hypothetical protein